MRRKEEHQNNNKKNKNRSDSGRVTAMPATGDSPGAAGGGALPTFAPEYDPFRSDEDDEDDDEDEEDEEEEEEVGLDDRYRRLAEVIFGETEENRFVIVENSCGNIYVYSIVAKSKL